MTLAPCYLGPVVFPGTVKNNEGPPVNARVVATAQLRVPGFALDSWYESRVIV